MRTLNLDTFWRTSIGFDRLFDLIDQSLLHEPDDNYPPCNIVRTGEDAYRISLAVAGFKPEQLDVSVQQNVLTIRGTDGNQGAAYQHRGILGRTFERRFSLADYVEVKGASCEDGLLQIELARELPETMKPRRIEVRSGKSLADDKIRTIEHRAA